MNIDPFDERYGLVRDIHTRLIAINEAQVNLLQAEEDLKSQLVELVGPEDDDVIFDGKPRFRISYSRRFNADKAAKALASHPRRADMEKLVIDSTLARAVLTGEEYAQCQNTSDKPTVRYL